MNTRLLSLVAGPALFILIALLPNPGGMSYAAQLVGGITLWIAIWWITEPVNHAVTSLLPLVMFPLCGMPLATVSTEYANELIFLFMAGFFFGKTIERWSLHRRIALKLIVRIGSNPSRTVLGFMVATAFISMWISNTATAVMMTPVAIAVASHARFSGPNFNKCLLLGVGYACSIGGLATIIGTPTNGIFLNFVQKAMGANVSFLQWFVFGFPFSVVLLILCWALLLWLFPLEKAGKTDNLSDTIQHELDSLGTVSLPERRLMWVFGIVIFAWVSGSLFWYEQLNHWLYFHLGAAKEGEKIPSFVGDTFVAISGALALFLLPAGKKDPAAGATQNTSLLDWPTAVKIPWGIILFFGSGLALAKAFTVSGLDKWLGGQLVGFSSLPHVLILLLVLVLVVALSEVASNIATASMMMPVLAALAGSIGAHPFGLLLSATMAASFGFGLPVATAPNTIVFSSGYMNTRDMARAGFILDAVAILLLLLFIYTVLPLVWGIHV